ncbi:MAG: hypothetical protein LBI08_01135 [Methanomassiliicoccaceae archaeon]|jgi:hypothetical protein|nr:hypothetical protein [Methanomassiliicoccaceae archaeon]
MNNELPLDIIKGMTGVIHAFYLDAAVLDLMRAEEAKVKKGTMDIGVANEGFAAALEREKVICIVKDKRFRPPPEPTVILRGHDGAILGEEVFPWTMHLYEGRDDLIWMGDGFVVFPQVEVKGGEQFVMPPIPFPELHSGNGCFDVVSSSPAPTTDLVIKNYYGLADDPKLATILVAFDTG